MSTVSSTEETLPSPVPFSPFSDSVTVSEPTSDERPDLGEFGFVFRTLTHLQPHPWLPAFNGVYQLDTTSSEATERGQERDGSTIGADTGVYDTGTGTLPEGSTVWHHHPIQSYLEFSSGHTRSPSERLLSQLDHTELQRIASTLASSDRDNAEHQQSREALSMPSPLSATEESEEADDEDVDTEGGRTVEISSNGSEDMDLSFEDGPESDSEEEIDPGSGYDDDDDDDDEEEIDVEGASEGVARIGMGMGSREALPALWRSPMRIPMRAYPHSWHSDDLPDEFGPFDGATTTSSGTRSTSHSEPPGAHFPRQIYDDQVTVPSPSHSAPASSVMDATVSMTSRTSPPTDSITSAPSSTSSPPPFPAHDDNSYSGYSDDHVLSENASYSDVHPTFYSPPDQPTSITGHVFSPPVNDNSTRSSSFSSTSPPLQPPFFSSPSMTMTPENANGRTDSVGNQPSDLDSPSLDDELHISIPHHISHHHRRMGSGSGSTSTITSAASTSTIGMRRMPTLERGPDFTPQPLSSDFRTTSYSRQAVHIRHDLETPPNSESPSDNDSINSNDNLNDDMLSSSSSSFHDTSKTSTTTDTNSENMFSRFSSADSYRDSFLDVHDIPGLASEALDDALDDSFPSLGFLDEALRFIADERARWEATRDTGASIGNMSSDSERWKHELDSDTTSNKTKSTASASDLLLLDPELELTPRKKKRKKPVRAVPVTSPLKKRPDRVVSGNTTPVGISILRPDGSLIGAGGIASASGTMRGRRRATSVGQPSSTGSDGHLGSGTLTPRGASSPGTALGHDGSGFSGETGDSAQSGAEATSSKKKKRKKGKEKMLIQSRSVPQLKILTDGIEVLAETEEASTSSNKTPLIASPATVRVKGGSSVNRNVNIANAQTHAVNTKRARLQALGRQLQDLFPEDEAYIDDVLASLDRQKKKAGKLRKKMLGEKVRERSRERGGVEEGEEEELDPRGRPSRGGEPLTHVFIDHSNILFGLLSYLKRNPPRRPLPPTPSTSTKPILLTPTSPPTLRQGSALSPASTTSTTTKTVTPTILPLPSFATARGKMYVTSQDVTDTGHEQESVTTTTTTTKRRVRHLSHTSLTFILERGRPVTRRVLVASSPLYQPVDRMERLGYEVRIYIRVPDLGDGMDRDHKDRQSNKTLARSNTHSGLTSKSSKRHSTGAFSASNSGSGSGSGYGSATGILIPVHKKRTHARHVSSGGTGTGSGVEQPSSASLDASGFASSSSAPTGGINLHAAMMQSRLKSGGSSASASGSGSGTPAIATGGTLSAPAPASGSGPAQRIRYREQGVDELLQLKLHQAIAATDDVPEGSTIVLATGDGNVGQFNEDGFLGPVRTALKRGWRVELYSWEGALSRAWKKEFGAKSEWGKTGRFRVIGMEQFALSLVEDGWVSV